jgi:hypothetical protein
MPIPIATVVAATDALVLLISMVKDLNWDAENMTDEELAMLRARRITLEARSNELVGELQAIADKYGTPPPTPDP